MILMRAAEMGEIVHNGYSKPSELVVIQNALKGGAKIYAPSDAEKKQFKDLGQKAYLDAMTKPIGQDWVDKTLAAAKKAEEDLAAQYQMRLK